MFMNVISIMLEPGIIITISLACIGAIVWAVRIEGRVNGHDARFVALEKLLEERDDRVLERHTEIGNRLFRMENKIDQGFLKGAKE